MNFQTLKQELVSDPLGRGYAGMTPSQVAASLNTPDRAIVVPTMVNARRLMKELGPVDGAAILDKLQAASQTAPPVRWAMAFLTSESGIDVGDPATRAQLDRLVANGVLTQTEASRIKAIAGRTVSRAQELGLPEVRAWHVEHIRKGRV